jgi:XTP/dITP diphosphohydrolase
MAPRVTFVTSNPNKFLEVRGILRGYGLAVRRRSAELPELQADTLEAVVEGKLAAARGIPGIVLVEDSGIFLDALGGFPGVYSAYVYRTIGLAGVLRLLAGRPRGARFRTVAGVRWGRRRWSCVGEVRGRIALRPRGDGGFGYDPLFVPAGARATFAELARDDKDARSHRGRAFRAVGERVRRELRRGGAAGGA